MPHHENHTDEIQVSVILGSWSSGSTAMTGYIERLGAYSCPPHVMTNDERTPNSHESKVLRDSLVQCVDEMTLKMRLNDRQVFRDWFVKWLQAEKQKAAHQGYRHIVLKHPLTAFFIEDIEAVCQPRWVVITRPFEAIESTRLRRRWHPVYGKAGANVIYNRIFNLLMNHSIAALCMNFDAFRQQADERIKLEAYLGLAPTAEQRDQADAWIVR
jgi:hypothetical protein